MMLLFIICSDGSSYSDVVLVEIRTQFLNFSLSPFDPFYDSDDPGATLGALWDHSFLFVFSFVAFSSLSYLFLLFHTFFCSFILLSSLSHLFFLSSLFLLFLFFLFLLSVSFCRSVPPEILRSFLKLCWQWNQNQME